MHTRLMLLLLGVAVEAVAAQAPAPVPPVPPAAAARPTPKPAPRAQSPGVPRAAWAPLLDRFQFELEMPSLPLPAFEFPHEPLLPPMGWELEMPQPPWPASPPLEPQWHHEPLLPPTPLAPMAPQWGHEEEARGNLSRMRPGQGSPEDSLFRRAREALSRGEYARASGMFESFVSKYPRSRVAPAAYYWSAFALYRSGSSQELQSALTMLRTQQERYPEAAADPDAATLRTRVYAALAARGDAQAANMLRTANAQGTSCDREEMEVRAEALNALAQLDAPEARPTLKRVLARRDECSATLRRRAVYILGRSGTEEAAADLLEAAKSDPDAGVRGDAIAMIGRAPGVTTVKVLEQIFNESTDERTRAAALSALRSKGGPEAKRALRAIIEKGDLPEKVRAEAIQQLGRSSENSYEVQAAVGRTYSVERDGTPSRQGGDEEDAAFLRGLYPKTDSRTIKGAIVSAVARMGGSANDQWLLAIAKNQSEDISLRKEALSRIKTSTLSIDELGKLFDALSERELRYAVVSQLANRDDPAAVDKLIEIAKSGTDPQVRRQAISALARKNDPRTTKLLLELVEKP